jgi:hypothetical protein
MGPDALVAVGTDTLAAAVEDKRDERLRNPELLGELGLGNFLGPRHERRI